jgi:hypothetical protein
MGTNKILLWGLMSLTAGCASNTQRDELSLAATTSRIENSSAMSVSETFRSSQVLKAGSFGNAVELSPGAVPVVAVGQAKTLSAPFVLDSQGSGRLVIKSYPTKVGNERSLFYPIVSIVDNDYSIRATLKPKYEFDFAKNTLTNEFSLPPNTRLILIHTSPEYFKHSFGEIAGNRNVSGAAVVGGVIGGALGAVVFGALSGSSDGSPAFSLGPIGKIQVDVE